MKSRVLLVGPADEQLEELNSELKQAGFLTETATDAMEGLEVGFWFQPQLVVTEVALSGINGFELALRIGAGQAGFSAKVIFYARSYRDEKSRQATSSKYGALGYFVKPFHKQALLDTVVELLTRIDLEGQAQVVLPPFPERSRNRATQPRWTPERLDAALSGNYPLVVSSQEEVADEQLRESYSEGQAADAESPPVGLAALTDETSYSVAPSSFEQESKPDSALKENLLPPLPSSDAEIQPDPAARNELSEGLTSRILDEPQVAKLARQPLSRAAKMLFAAAAAMLAIGLSVSLWLSRSASHQMSRQNSNSPLPVKDQTSASNRDVSETSPVALGRPAEPGEPASEALIRWLSGSRAAEDTDSQARAIAPRGQQANAVRSSTPELVIRDVSSEDQQPFLTAMSRPSLSPDQIRSMGARSYEVRIELDPSGRVTAARLLTPNTGGSFPKQVLDTVQQWRFVPRDKSQQGAWVKHFVFQAKSPEP
jgi:TonB family protein